MDIEKCTILAIDDNDDNLLTLKALISEYFPSFKVFLANDGRKGLETALFEDPDIILLDVVMPGMDGFDVCKRIKNHRSLADVPVVFLTAVGGSREHRIQALECGGDAFLSKPIDEQEFIAQIQAMSRLRKAAVEKRTEQQRLARLVEEQTRELQRAHTETLHLVEALRAENDVRKKFEAALLEVQHLSHIGSLEYDVCSGIITGTDELGNILGIETTGRKLADADLQSLIDPLDKVRVNQTVHQAVQEHAVVEFPCSIIRPDGVDCVVQILFKPVYSPEGRHVRSVLSIQDVTRQKKAEEYLRYLGSHDYLTRLLNRRCYEERLNAMDQPQFLPLSIAMVDVNGLKLINDSFGYSSGDRLLRTAADVIVRNCRQEDVVARWGGDEFMVLMPQTDADQADVLLEAVKEEASAIRVGSLQISLSFGIGTRHTMSESIARILTEVEDAMYRQKIHEASSARSKTIDIIMKTLFEKSNRESLHSKRVSELCEEIAVRMDFPKDTVNHIRIAGLLHDIGKMGISEEVLNKPGRLDDHEWIEMKKHPEIGYRILSAVPEFSEMAIHVLQHHERWDGNGYPNRLRGEDISFEARIIAVADSFDAMTSSRSYRTGLSQDEAITEILKCSGMQFDPRIASVMVGIAQESQGTAV